jgi:hypothetical protein
MDNFKYKLKEAGIGDTDVRDGKKSTLTDIDPETGTLTWTLEDVPAFDTTFKKFAQAKKFLQKLSIDKNDDSKIRELSKKLTDTFNDFRTHLRKNYPQGLYQEEKVKTTMVHHLVNQHMELIHKQDLKK